MAKGHRSQIKRERNSNKDTRPSAKLSFARIPVQKACFVLDAIRGKDVETALAILAYNPRYENQQLQTQKTTTVWTEANSLSKSATQAMAQS